MLPPRADMSRIARFEMRHELHAGARDRGEQEAEGRAQATAVTSGHDQEAREWPARSTPKTSAPHMNISVSCATATPAR